MGNIYSYFFPALDGSVQEASTVILAEEESFPRCEHTSRDILMEHTEDISVVLVPEKIEHIITAEDISPVIEETSVDILAENTECTIMFEDIAATEDGFEVIADRMTEDDSMVILEKAVPEPEVAAVDDNIVILEKAVPDPEVAAVDDSVVILEKTVSKPEVPAVDDTIVILEKAVPEPEVAAVDDSIVILEKAVSENEVAAVDVSIVTGDKEAEIGVKEELEADSNPLAALRSGVQALIVELTPDSEGEAELKEEPDETKEVSLAAVKKENDIVTTNEDIVAEMEAKLESIGIIEETKDDSQEISVKAT